MSTFSTIPTVKAALVTAITTAVSPVKTYYGHPGEGNIPREAVWVGGLTEWDDETPWLGSVATREQYALAVNIVTGDTNAPSFQIPTERCFAVADLIHTAVHGLSDLGAVHLRTALQFVPRPAGFTEFFTDDKGGGVARAVLLEFSARIDVRV